MRYIATADWHLGFRGPGRIVGGRNQREIDVEDALVYLTHQALTIRPDMVFVAGDCFHSVRPSFHAVKAFQTAIRAMTEEGIQVVIVAGNHESPRTAETLSPNVVVDSLCSVIDRPMRLMFEVRGEFVAVSCLPFVALEEQQEFKVAPDLDADVNVLVMHAAVQTSAVDGALPKVYGGAAAYDVGREAEKWDVIALGDYHQFTRLHPTRPVFYPGSIERTSSNIWDEHAPKGFVVGDTEKGTFEFVRIPTREMSDYNLGDFDFPPGVSAAEVNACLDAMTGYEHLQDGLVRFTVDSFPRSERDAIDWKLVSQLRDRCVLFNLDLRMADRESADLGDRRDRQGKGLRDEAEEFFAEDPEPVKEAAFEYLGLEQAATLST